MFNLELKYENPVEEAEIEHAKTTPTSAAKSSAKLLNEVGGVNVLK